MVDLHLYTLLLLYYYIHTAPLIATGLDFISGNICSAQSSATESNLSVEGSEAD